MDDKKEYLCLVYIIDDDVRIQMQFVWDHIPCSEDNLSIATACPNLDAGLIL